MDTRIIFCQILIYFILYYVDATNYYFEINERLNSLKKMLKNNIFKYIM